MNSPRRLLLLGGVLAGLCVAAAPARAAIDMEIAQNGTRRPFYHRAEEQPAHRAHILLHKANNGLTDLGSDLTDTVLHAGQPMGAGSNELGQILTGTGSFHQVFDRLAARQVLQLLRRSSFPDVRLTWGRPTGRAAPRRFDLGLAALGGGAGGSSGGGDDEGGGPDTTPETNEDDSLNTTPIPEPTTGLALLAGAAALFGRRPRRRATEALPPAPPLAARLTTGIGPASRGPPPEPRPQLKPARRGATLPA